MDIKSHRSCSICRDIWCWGTSTHSFQFLVGMYISLSDSKHHRSLFGFDWNPTITPYNLGIGGWMQMFEHPCQEGDEARIRCFGAQRVEPSWKLHGFTSCHKWQLKEFQFGGFRPLLEQHFLFVSTVMGRAPDLKTVLLTDGQYPCKGCDTRIPIPPPVGGFFPTYMDAQEAIAKQLRERVRSSAQIIFRSGSTYPSRATRSCIY